MVAIQDTELREGILEGIDRAKTLKRSVLVSEVHKVDQIEPLYFFAAGKEQFLGERFFWKDPANKTILVGLGIGKQIQSVQAADRFFHVEEEWKRFIEHSVIINEFGTNGVGPLMFGGFSFDPLKEKTRLWSKYPDSLFHIPKYLLSIISGEVFFTTNIVCTPHDDYSLFEKVKEERQSILNAINNRSRFDIPALAEKVEVDPDGWKKSVQAVVDDLETGTLKKVVLARELRLRFNQEVLVEGVLSNLIKEQEDSFIFAFESHGDCFLGASPERLVKKQGDAVFSTCLAGSIARGKTVVEDRELGDMLLSDQKNLIEHQYVVDMIKEAMAETCDEIYLPDKPALMKMRDIQHLYTPVSGKISKEQSLLLLVKRLHPTPALGGLPTKEAIEKIREVEIMDRGFYAGPLGWLDYKGNGEFAVSIRSGLVQGKEASLFAGCGIVSDSDPDSEFSETRIKFRPMLSALGGK